MMRNSPVRLHQVRNMHQLCRIPNKEKHQKEKFLSYQDLNFPQEKINHLFFIIESKTYLSVLLASWCCSRQSFLRYLLCLLMSRSSISRWWQCSWYCSNWNNNSTLDYIGSCYCSNWNNSTLDYTGSCYCSNWNNNSTLDYTVSCYCSNWNNSTLDYTGSCYCSNCNNNSTLDYTVSCYCNNWNNNSTLDYTVSCYWNNNSTLDYTVSCYCSNNSTLDYTVSCYCNNWNNKYN